MVATPFLGPAYISRSKNLADQQLINLFVEIVETKTGKTPGAFYMTPGLDLLATCGTGPVRGLKAVGSTLYVVAGSNVYSVSLRWGVTLLGSIATRSGAVSIIANSSQVVIFDGVNGYLAPGGYPLTAGTIGTGGTGYSAGDTLVLTAVGGSQSAAVTLEVSTVSAGAITAFTIYAQGAFPTQPTSFTQYSTDGSGAGFTLTSPTYGTFANLYTVPLPFSGPLSASYQDGFGLVSVAGSQLFYQSTLDDLSTWQPLAFSSADSTPANIVAIAEISREQWVFKSDSTEIWTNEGLSNFAFQRLDGAFLEMGCAATFSVANTGESLIWLMQNNQGQGMVVHARGYAAQPISTQGMQTEFATYPTLSDAIAYTYQQEGHLFYVLTFPSGNATWVYDLTASALAGIPMWHKRASLSNGAFNRHLGNAYTFFNGQHVIGDYASGNLYAYDLDTLTDNGATRKWVRSWRALPKPSEHPVRFSSLRIDMETGSQEIPQGTTPNCMLRWSDDGGHTWSDYRIAPVGPVGATAMRVKFNRLGSTRRNSGLDRIFELSSADQFKVALLGAELQ